MFGNHDHQAQQQGADDTYSDNMQDTGIFSDAPASNPAAPPADVFGGSASTTVRPANDQPGPSAPSAPAANPVGNDDLLGIKQDALQQLSPLVGHLDQSPEEKFRTTMMMIQASDDQTLLRTAYEAAKQISDDKARAQALLDVVNEINYFTQQHNA